MSELLAINVGGMDTNSNVKHSVRHEAAKKLTGQLMQEEDPELGAYVLFEQPLQLVPFAGALPAGHVEQNKASLVFEYSLLLHFVHIPLTFKEDRRT